jgi:hypothetical protein
VGSSPITSTLVIAGHKHSRTERATRPLVPSYALPTCGPGRGRRHARRHPSASLDACAYRPSVRRISECPRRVCAVFRSTCSRTSAFAAALAECPLRGPDSNRNSVRNRCGLVPRAPHPQNIWAFDRVRCVYQAFSDGYEDGCGGLLLNWLGRRHRAGSRRGGSLAFFWHRRLRLGRAAFPPRWMARRSLAGSSGVKWSASGSSGRPGLPHMAATGCLCSDLSRTRRRRCTERRVSGSRGTSGG